MSKSPTLTQLPWQRTRAPARGDRSGAANPFADRRLMARAGFALLLANVRYWATVAPLVRTELSVWEQRAQAIGDPLLRAAASSKLREERFNVEVAATLATLATRAHRAHAIKAIVALQVMYDYLDLLTEQPPPDSPLAPDPLADGRHLYGAFVDALTLDREPGGDYYRHHPQADDGGYLQALVEAARDALGRLPGAAAVAEVAQISARRCAEAQVRSHAAVHAGGAELECWAGREATGTALRWPELLAGATASVLAVHALIAAAAGAGATHKDAEQLDAVYLSIAALGMLDSLVDHERDIAAGAPGYVQYYDSPKLMGVRLVSVATDAAAQARALPNAAHHLVTLVGIVAYYASAPAASSACARPVMEQLRGELRPLITPTLALMRAWRLFKRQSSGDRRHRFARPAMAEHTDALDKDRRRDDARSSEVEDGRCIVCVSRTLHRAAGSRHVLQRSSSRERR